MTKIGIHPTTDALPYRDALHESLRKYGAGDGEISDHAARAIAMVWQSPDAIGRHLAALASCCEVECSDVLDDVAASRRYCDTTADGIGLDMLATWALDQAAMIELADLLGSSDRVERMIVRGMLSPAARDATGAEIAFQYTQANGLTWAEGRNEVRHI